MKINREGVSLIKAYEGLRTTAYLDAVKVWTIGYGHTSMAGEPLVTKGMKITAQEAEEILLNDLVKYEAAVTRALKRVPNENQFAAMVSLCFNIGPGAFAGSSLVRHFNAGNLDAAANAFLLWKKAGNKVLPGLVRRRQSERELFLKPVRSASKVVSVEPDAPKEGREKLTRDRKPVLKHRFVQSTLGALGGGAGFLGVFTGWQWEAMAVFAVFCLIVGGAVWYAYRKEIRAGLFSPEEE